MTAPTPHPAEEVRIRRPISYKVYESIQRVLAVVDERSDEFERLVFRESVGEFKDRVSFYIGEITI